MLPPILILAGGMGSRVAHISGNLPKCLIPINGVPFIKLQLDLLASSGINHVVYSVGFKENIIKDYVESLNLSNIKIDFISDGEIPLGTGGAVENAKPVVGSEFFVIYGDSYLEIDYQQFYEFSKDKEASMVIYKNLNRFEKSNVKKIADNLIFYEKGATSTDYEYVDCGLLYFKSSVFDSLQFPQSFDLAKILSSLSRGRQLWGFESVRRFYEIGSETGIHELVEHLRTGSQDA